MTYNWEKATSRNGSPWHQLNSNLSCIWLSPSMNCSFIRVTVHFFLAQARVVVVTASHFVFWFCPSWKYGRTVPPYSFKCDMRLDMANNMWTDLLYVTSGQKSLRGRIHVTMFSFPAMASKYIPNGGGSVDSLQVLIEPDRKQHSPPTKMEKWEHWHCVVLYCNITESKLA